MCHEPVVTNAALGDEGHGQMNGVLHVFDYDPADLLDFINGNVEVQFVVHLHDHLRLQTTLLEFAVDGDHGDLDDVGSSALHRCVHGVAFGKSTDGSVMRNDVRQVTLAPEQRLYIQMFARESFLRLDERLNLRERRKIVVDKLLGFGARAVELLREPERRYAVQDTEVGGLGFAALLFGDLLNGHPEDLRRRGSVDILSAAESGEQMLVLREVRHEPEFDLRVVGTQDLAALIGNHRTADELSALRTDRQVLHVRVR